MKHVATSHPVAHFTTLSTVDQRRLEPCVHAWRVLCSNGGVISRVQRSRGVNKKCPSINCHSLGTATRRELGAFFERRKHLTSQEPADVWHHLHLSLIGWFLQAFAPLAGRRSSNERNDSSHIGSSSSSRRSSTSDASRAVTSKSNFSHQRWRLISNHNCPSFAIYGIMGLADRQRQTSSNSSSSAKQNCSDSCLAHRLNSQWWSAEVHGLGLNTQRRTPKSCVDKTTWEANVIRDGTTRGREDPLSLSLWSGSVSPSGACSRGHAATGGRHSLKGQLQKCFVSARHTPPTTSVPNDSGQWWSCPSLGRNAFFVAPQPHPNRRNYPEKRSRRGPKS